MTSAFSASLKKIAFPSSVFRLSVRLRLLRCRFWKSKPSRREPVTSPLATPGDRVAIAGRAALHARPAVLAVAEGRTRESRPTPPSDRRERADAQQTLAVPGPGVDAAVRPGGRQPQPDQSPRPHGAPQI